MERINAVIFTILSVTVLRLRLSVKMVALTLVSLQNRSFCRKISQQGINHIKMAFFAEKENAEENEGNHDGDGTSNRFRNS